MSFYAQYPVIGSSGGGVPVYANFAAFPAGTTIGQLAVAQDTGDLYEWNGTTWVLLAAPGTTVVAVGPFGSSPNAAGASISGNTLTLQPADSTHPGALSSADWNTFNNKQAAGNYITALTGDGAASGPGSAALTLATVNSNTGSFGSSTAIPTFTVNGKGLITAASTAAVVAPAGTLTGTVLASNVVTSSLNQTSNLAIGAAGISWKGVAIFTTLTGNATQKNFDAEATFSSGATSAGIGFHSHLTTAAGSYTIPYVADFIADTLTLGAGSVVTNHVGFFCSASGGSNLAQIADNNSATGTWFINQSGTAASTLGGALTLSAATGTSLTVSSTTDSTTISTGSIVSSGGLGIAKAAVLGGPYIIVGGSNTSQAYLQTKNSVGQLYAGVNDHANTTFTNAGADQPVVYTNTSLKLMVNNGTVAQSITSAGATTIGSTSLNVAHSLANNSTSNDTFTVTNGDATTSSDVRSDIICVKGSTTNTAGTNRFITFSINAGSTGSGYVGSNGANSAAFFNTSDARLKTNVRPLDSALDTVRALNPVVFDWKDGSTLNEVGFIAQEIAAVLPDQVNKTDEGQGDDLPPGTNPWSMTESGMIPYLVKAIQELSAELEALKLQIKG